MQGLLFDADGLLRGTFAARVQRPIPVLRLLGIMTLFGVAYGAVMGTFGGVSPDRLVQVAISAAKVPLLLACTFALGLPTFFVLNTLIGLRDDFVEAIRALAATQAGLTVVLASLSPFTAVWYLSVPDYGSAKLFNAVMFALASGAGQVMLKRAYAPLIRRDRRHRTMLRAWLVIYAFVGIQMAWVLRPFIGAPGLDVRLFRAEAWGNAYLEIWRLMVGLFG